MAEHILSDPAYRIPGVLECFDPSRDPLPLLFDSPHSGRDYPADFAYRVPLAALRRAEDGWVDELYGAAPGLGAFLIRALFPRTYIDVNRHPRDIDPQLIEGEWPETPVPTEKSRLGVGLVWRLAPPGLPIYQRRLAVAAIQQRLDRYYHPYHGIIEQTIDRLQEMFGAVWHVDCHSMPSVGNDMAPDPGRPRPDFAIGDRDGTSCSPMFTEFVVETLRGMGYDVRINDPYKGAELVRRHGDPVSRRNSLQIEINRALYMNEETREKNAGFNGLRDNVTKLICALASYVRTSNA